MQENADNSGGETTAGNFPTKEYRDSFQSFYPLIVEAAQEGIWLLDTKGTTIYANVSMANMLGTTIADLAGRNFADFLFEDQGNAAVNKELLQMPENEPFEHRYRRSGGEECWVSLKINKLRDPHGTLQGVVATNVNISEKKFAETALKNSFENTDLVINSIRDFAIMTVNAEREVLSWNTGAEIIFGYSAAEITGTSSDKLFTAQDRADEVPRKEVDTAIAKGHSYDDRWHLKKDGSVFFASGVMTKLNTKGNALRFIKIARDLTDRKNLEEMLTKADRHKNEFLATLAHELRNPLASILSSVEVLKQERDFNKTIKTRDIIERQIQQMIHLVNDLLDISRISLGKIKITRQPINIIDTIHLALETSRAIVEGYNHAVTISLPAGPLMVNGDLTRLTQVFQNILVNSAKYTPPKGQITLVASRENDEVIVRVTDNGMGIPPQMLSSIFEMFEQIQDRSEYPQAGLGIGLSVVKQLVEMHDGQVRAYSEGMNKGSEFVIQLPLIKNQNEAFEQVNAPERVISPITPLRQAEVPGKKILLIDDNVDALDMLEILLRKKGHTIKKAYNGRSGIATAMEFDPEIVLLDLGLPDINGYEVLKELKSSLGEKIYLALSGWGQDEDLRRSKEAGFSHHLVKPIDIHSLNDLLVAL